MDNIDVEQRVAAARNNFTSGYNCSQSVALAFVDLFDVDPSTIVAVASSFGGGMGRLREVCGAVSGMAIIAGLIIPATDVENKGVKTANYSLVQEMAEKFRSQNRSIVCRELLGLDRPKDEPTPSDRTAEYYRKRPCADLVADAARILAETINDRGTASL
ncbi:MAG: C-GCAxxG-C-C family protein [Rikenellaceae bacterium]